MQQVYTYIANGFYLKDPLPFSQSFVIVTITIANSKVLNLFADFPHAAFTLKCDRLTNLFKRARLEWHFHFQYTSSFIALHVRTSHLYNWTAHTYVLNTCVYARLSEGNVSSTPLSTFSLLLCLLYLSAWWFRVF